MSRVRHVYASRGEHIKVHRNGGGGSGVGCIILIIVAFILMRGC
ncbi:MAG: hypothetical protein WCI51_01705 [Lentisphaerota bacterium]